MTNRLILNSKDIALLPSVTSFMNLHLIDHEDKPKIKEWVERCRPEIVNWQDHIEYGGEELKKLMTKLMKN